MVSTKELERRWKELRKVMAERGIDWVVCESSSERLGGHVRWLTDRTHIYTVAAAIPVEGDVYYVSHGDHLHHKPKSSPGIKHIVAPYVQTLQLSTGAELLLDVLKRSRPSKVGLAGFGRLSAATYIALKKGLPDVEFVDATDIIDELKAVKSEEEIEYIRKTAEMHDKVWEEVVMRVVRPGKKPLDVIREVWNAMMKEGSVMGWYRANASPPDIPCQYFGPLDRVIKEGDVFAMLMEFSGPEGYYCEIMRNVCLGRIPRELEEAFEDVKEAQSRMAKKLLPNTDPNEVLKEGDGLMREKGWPVETRLAGHGQGLDLVERPAIFTHR